MHRQIWLALIVAAAVSGVHAQEEAVSRTWTLTSTLTTGAEERLNCTLVFPTEEGKPQLRISMRKQTEPAKLNFELRGVGQLATADRDPVANVGLAIGPRTVEEGSTGTWREVNEGRLSFASAGAGSALLQPIAQSTQMTVTAGDKSYAYDLTGSRKAINEMQKCLR